MAKSTAKSTAKAKFDAKALYEEIKKGKKPYVEEVHCPMILEVMNNEGTMTAFCKKAGISDRLFYKWCVDHPVFDDCYQVGRMLSKSNWENEGELGKNDPDFNFEYWRITGASRYGIGKTNRVRMAVDHLADPYKQYQQLLNQAASEEFTASEIKQLMESINIGIRAHESFVLQNEIDTMKKDLLKMSTNNGNYHVPIAAATKTN